MEKLWAHMPLRSLCPRAGRIGVRGVQRVDGRDVPVVAGQVRRHLVFVAGSGQAGEVVLRLLHHTPESAMSAIMFGIAMSPLKMSAMVHTAATVMYGPMNTAAM